jgi:hypothetical protein
VKPPVPVTRRFGGTTHQWSRLSHRPFQVQLRTAYGLWAWIHFQNGRLQRQNACTNRRQLGAIRTAVAIERRFPELTVNDRDVGAYNYRNHEFGDSILVECRPSLFSERNSNVRCSVAVSRLAQTGPEQALSSLVWIMREGANAVPDDGERFRSLRAICLVAHQRTAWAMPERTISGAKRIAAPLAQACQEVTGGRRQS